jgi:hypothetical protein
MCMNVVFTSISVSFMHGKCICLVKFAIVFDDASSLLYCFISVEILTRFINGVDLHIIVMLHHVLGFW